jgi:Uma2 family endonuclease
MMLPRLFTVAEYYRMGDIGILPEDASVELIEGSIVEAFPMGPHHAACIDKLSNLFFSALDDKLLRARIRNPVRFSEYTELQPDISIVHAREDSYCAKHPTPPDVLFLIEVADASLMYVRHTKLPLYLRSGIAEVWLVDLVNRAVEVHSPDGVRRVRAGESVVSSVLPELQIAAGDILL